MLVQATVCKHQRINNNSPNCGKYHGIEKDIFSIGFLFYQKIKQFLSVQFVVNKLSQPEILNNILTAILLNFSPDFC